MNLSDRAFNVFVPTPEIVSRMRPGYSAATNAAQLQTEINRIAATGFGRLRIPGGTYQVNAGVRLSSVVPIEIVGDYGGTWLQPTIDLNGHVIELRGTSDPTSWPGFRGFIFGLGFRTSVAQTGGACIHVQGAHGFAIHNVLVGYTPARNGSGNINFYRGISLYKQDACEIRDCKVSASNRCYSIVHEAGDAAAFQMNGVISGCWGWGNDTAGTVGIYVERGGGIRILDLTMENIGYSFWFKALREITMRNADADQCYNKGFYFEDDGVTPAVERFFGAFLYASGCVEQGFHGETMGQCIIEAPRFDNCPNSTCMQIDSATYLKIAGGSLGVAFATQGGPEILSQDPSLIVGAGVEELVLQDVTYNGISNSATLTSIVTGCLNLSTGDPRPEITQVSVVDEGAIQSGSYIAIWDGPDNVNDAFGFYPQIDGSGPGASFATNLNFGDYDSGALPDAATILADLKAAIDASGANVTTSIGGTVLTITTGTNTNVFDSSSADPAFMAATTTQQGRSTAITQVSVQKDYPTSDPHVVGQLWNNGGVLMISAG